jgi:hypothetical protein
LHERRLQLPLPLLQPLLPQLEMDLQLEQNPVLPLLQEIQLEQT